MKRKIWVERKVSAGRVRIYGDDYSPSTNYQPYDGRLDGSRQSFAIYPKPDGSHETFVFHGDTPEVDGGIPWTFWYRVTP